MNEGKHASTSNAAGQKNPNENKKPHPDGNRSLNFRLSEFCTYFPVEK